jgi:hypothetical protein
MQIVIASNVAGIFVAPSVEGACTNPGLFRRAYPPSSFFTQPLLNHFQALLRVWASAQDVSDMFPQLTSHLENITSLFSNSIVSDGLAQPEIGR